MSELGLRVTPLTPEYAEALAALFERAGHTCYCRYAAFGGDKHAWQDRLANHPERNKAELVEAVRKSDPDLRGVVALHEDRVVGWLKLTPATGLEKLYQQRLYRGLPCFAGDRRGVYTLGCYFVEPEWRRRGLALRLTLAAIELARDVGASAVEALARGAGAHSDAELWLGHPNFLLSAGFRIVHDFAPYPVLRLELH